MIPRSKAAVQDTLIAGAFIAMGALLPGSLLDKGFEAHVGGIALGIGIGWLVKSVINHSTGVQRES
ncbi:MAG: hypothetical protein IT368_08400 [Candidatus Hydrogenedentes bacterium]|nr:hypothetical protein [Candidatus Hydrogenedentota bacterium]